MEYGINVGFLAKTVGLQKAAQLVAKAGFTQLDYTPPIREDNWKTVMKDAMAIFADLGLTVHQTHAPFNRYGSYGDKHILCMDRCAEATAYMGAKFMVAHADEFDFERLVFTPEAAMEYNRNLFMPYVELAQKAGYKMAFETVFEDRAFPRRYTSDADELLGMIQAFESAAAVCCWDFGHANVMYPTDAPAQIRKLGKLIQCTHLHDNTGVDAHQMPLTGDINWKATMDAFKEVGYSGVMSVEYAHGSIPAHLMEDFVNLTFRSSQHAWSL